MRGDFEKIISDIKSVKIQGAENVAKAGIIAYSISPKKKSLKKILSTRPTEPLMQNMLNLMKKSKDEGLAAKKLIGLIEKDHKRLARIGARLIKNDMNIYTHCHSSSVIDILTYAKKTRKKKFVVYTTEVEPLLQGRKTARDLSKLGIKVVVAPDLAAENLLKRCDIFLFGADAVTKKFLVNKIGTRTLCKIAEENKIPRYSCSLLLKFTKKVKIEKRPENEVWNIRSKNIEIENFAFDKTPLKLISGIVCEEGIFLPKEFLKRAKKKLREISFVF
ncbi:hypothetical protein D6829_02225 [Candidatus Pacearchaeota archaeon]|nr:MAG: hypothetical protein D6829_02225 [Candidatus Pacearchaeota archaeon]